VSAGINLTANKNENNMKILSKLNEVATSCGNIRRGIIEVGCKEFRIEVDLDYKSLQVIDENASGEGFEIDQDANIVAINGEHVTGDWSDADWREFDAYIGAPKRVTKYIALDCNGDALQFTGSGRSIQCGKDDADKFESEEAAEAALKLAEETGGSTEEIEVYL
jgi:hypothetical protein